MVELKEYGAASMKHVLVWIGGGAGAMAVYRLAIGIFSEPVAPDQWMTARPSGPWMVHTLPYVLAASFYLVVGVIIRKQRSAAVVTLGRPDLEYVPIPDPPGPPVAHPAREPALAADAGKMPPAHDVRAITLFHDEHLRIPQLDEAHPWVTRALPWLGLLGRIAILCVPLIVTLIIALSSALNRLGYWAAVLVDEGLRGLVPGSKPAIAWAALGAIAGGLAGAWRVTTRRGPLAAAAVLVAITLTTGLVRVRSDEQWAAFWSDAPRRDSGRLAVLSLTASDSPISKTRAFERRVFVPGDRLCLSAVVDRPPRSGRVWVSFSLPLSFHRGHVEQIGAPAVPIDDRRGLAEHCRIVETLVAPGTYEVRATAESGTMKSKTATSVTVRVAARGGAR